MATDGISNRGRIDSWPRAWDTTIFVVAVSVVLLPVVGAPVSEFPWSWAVRISMAYVTFHVINLLYMAMVILKQIEGNTRRPE